MCRLVDILKSDITIVKKELELIEYCRDGGEITSEALSYMIQCEPIMLTLVSLYTQVDIDYEDYNYTFCIAVYTNKHEIVSNMIKSSPDLMDMISHKNFFPFLYPFYKGYVDIVDIYMSNLTLIELLPIYDYFALRYSCIHNWNEFVGTILNVLLGDCENAHTLRCITKAAEEAAAHGNLETLILFPDYIVERMDPRIINYVTSEIKKYLCKKMIGVRSFDSYKFDGKKVINGGVRYIKNHKYTI
jgi:hypothetical protein